jgi:hypothetical protein
MRNTAASTSSATRQYRIHKAYPTSAPSKASNRTRFQFTGRQQLIHGSLVQKSQEMADLYESALRVCWDEGNPGCFVLAPHSIREMTGNLPKVLDLPVLGETGRLGDQVDARALGRLFRRMFLR